jgi:hypothetical protein
MSRNFYSISKGCYAQAITALSVVEEPDVNHCKFTLGNLKAIINGFAKAIKRPQNSKHYVSIIKNRFRTGVL